MGENEDAGGLAGGGRVVTCPACAEAERDPLTAMYCSGCDECDARSLSGCVQFLEVMELRSMTDRWRALLRVIAGDERDKQEALHRRVKAWHARREAFKMKV